MELRVRSALTHAVQTGTLLHLLPAALSLPLQLSLLLLQVDLQLCDAFAQPVLIQQAVGVLQLQAVSAAQSLIKTHTHKHEKDAKMTTGL